MANVRDMTGGSPAKNILYFALPLALGYVLQHLYQVADAAIVGKWVGVEGLAAVGAYSFIDASTLFAVGNGSSHTDRKNAFEVRTDGVVLRSPNGTRYKITVDNSGNLTTAAI